MKNFIIAAAVSSAIALLTWRVYELETDLSELSAAQFLEEAEVRRQWEDVAVLETSVQLLKASNFEQWEERVKHGYTIKELELRIEVLEKKSKSSSWFVERTFDNAFDYTQALEVYRKLDLRMWADGLKIKATAR